MAPPFGKCKKHCKYLRTNIWVAASFDLCTYPGVVILFNLLWGHLRHSCDPGKTTVLWTFSTRCSLNAPLKTSEHRGEEGSDCAIGFHRCPTAGGAHTPALALSQPTPRPCRGAARIAACHSEPPGSHPSTRPTAPDSAQPIISRAAALPAAAPIRRRRPWSGRCPCILRSSSRLELREFLRDAVTPTHTALPLGQGETQRPWVWALVHRCLGGRGSRLNRAGQVGHVGGRVPPQQSTRKIGS